VPVGVGTVGYRFQCEDCGIAFEDPYRMAAFVSASRHEDRTGHTMKEVR